MSDPRDIRDDPGDAARRALRADVEALEDALRRLGVEVRREPLPDGTRGGLVRLGAKVICFVPEGAGLGGQRDALLDALRRVPSDAVDAVFLPPRARALRGDL